MANASIRYGASIRKRADKIRHEKIARYNCEECGKSAVRRLGTGIWKCRHCGTVYAGGAYSMTTAAGSTAKRLIQGLQKA
ncbi:MAG: 50S ribosomal protein L37ae [Candidatus Micrarchaeaceae archaeon]|jgi:large subunit ribosomal protein L37Ae|nr:50S ribosomal protein L37ae [Candidatus Micrarchaeota archaeon]HII09701.1 50S ribosomal protein L37ae [Candidatus Micrarchaeota archaeon]